MDNMIDGVECEPAELFARMEDGHARLWTPHRIAYIKHHDKPTETDNSLCPFCAVSDDPASGRKGKSDEEGLVIRRGETCFALLNLFPYNSAHSMVCPYRHVASYIDLTPAETNELAQMTQELIRTLQYVYHPDGFNLGINQGEIAGAGIAAHLHQHVVPRWVGDANFLPIIGQTKAVPTLLGESQKRLSEAWSLANES